MKSMDSAADSAADSPRPCGRCNGEKQIQCEGVDGTKIKRTCPACGGSGASAVRTK